MSGTSADTYPQKFVFSHYPSPFSPGEDYTVEVLRLTPARLLVILDGSTAGIPHSIDEDELPDLASRLWRKRLYHHDPEMIFWAIRVPSAESTTDAAGETDPKYQRLDFLWDGERYSRAQRRVMFNRAAFQTAFPGISDRAAS